MFSYWVLLKLLPSSANSLLLPLQTVGAYFRLNWVIINKLQGKAVTHGEKLEWWIILMVDCVTILLHFSTIRFPSANLRANGNTKVNDHTKSLWVGSKLLCATFES